MAGLLAEIRGPCRASEDRSLSRATSTPAILAHGAVAVKSGRSALFVEKTVDIATEIRIIPAFCNHRNL
jgi:hypothetical protein